MSNLTEEQLDEYGIIPGKDGSGWRSYAEVKDKTLENVWTLVDGEDGGIYAIPGFHVVNNIGYILTEKAWTDDIEEACYWPRDEDDGHE